MFRWFRNIEHSEGFRSRNKLSYYIVLEIPSFNLSEIFVWLVTIYLCLWEHNLFSEKILMQYFIVILYVPSESDIEGITKSSVQETKFLVYWFGLPD